MINRLLSILTFATALVLTTVSTIWATPFTVTVDISSLAGLDIELELDLFDNDFIIGNSHVLIDNVSIRDISGTIVGPGLIDFEGGVGDFGGFDISLNPASVSNVAGAFPGDSGSRQLRIDEDLLFTPTITFRDFLPSSATQLRFDFEFITPAGSPDSFVASLLDPITLLPFPTISDLSGGLFGDVLEATSAPLPTIAQGTTATVIPEPSTLLLFGIGVLGMFGIAWRRRV